MDAIFLGLSALLFLLALGLAVASQRLEGRQ
jgi:hypothetical protein